MKVRTYDYMLPIIFTYKGWNIVISESSSFFKFADIKVDITISIDPYPYYSMLIQAYEEQEQIKMRRTSFAPNRCNISPAQKNKIMEIVNDFIKTQNKISYSQSANGDMLDRFMGQNISAIKKVHQNTIDYIDSTLGIADVRNKFVDYLKINNI